MVNGRSWDCSHAVAPDYSRHLIACDCIYYRGVRAIAVPSEWPSRNEACTASSNTPPQTPVTPRTHQTTFTDTPSNHSHPTTTTYLTDIDVHQARLSVHPGCIIAQNPAQRALTHVCRSHQHHLHTSTRMHMTSCETTHKSLKMVQDTPTKLVLLVGINFS